MDDDRHSENCGADVAADPEPLILVDETDREVGHLSKARCHQGRGVLHRAFSLLIFNDAGEWLLQQRAPSKRLWPLYWSNSVFIVRSTGPVSINQNEIVAWRWSSPEALQAEMTGPGAESFTPWFVLEWQRIWRDHREVILAFQSES